MNQLCQYSLIQEATDSCQYVIQNCVNQSTIQFTKYYFCEFNQELLYLLIFTPTFMFIMFSFLIKTADDYLSPAVAYIANHFKLSQTLAGITLIAFANGAPDVLTAFVASTNEDDILISIGSIFGSGLLMTTLIFGSVIYHSKYIRANRVAYKRDLIFNGIGISMIIIFSLIGYINYVMSTIFVLLYVIYIVVVLFNEKQEELDCKQIQQKMQQQSFINEECQGLLNESDNNFSFANNNGLLEDDEKDRIKDITDNSKIKDQQINPQFIEAEQVEFSNKSFPQKLCYFYEKPIEYIRITTIPSCETEQMFLKVINCIICPISMIILLQLDISKEIYLSMQLWQFALLMGVILSLYEIIIGIQKIVIAFICVICSIIWCKIIIEILVDYMLLIQTLTSLNYPYLGMTFLAFGNSSCDLFVNTKLAQIGYGVMAMTGCFSGAFFNMNVGFGAALLKLSWMKDIKFDFFNSLADSGRIIAFCLLAFSLGNIIISGIVIYFRNFKLNRQVSYYYFSFYGCFFLSITTFTIFLESSIN